MKMRVPMYHATHWRHVESIMQEGIRGLPLGDGRTAPVCFVPARRIAWAINHVCKRHHWKPSDIAVVKAMVIPHWAKGGMPALLALPISRLHPDYVRGVLLRRLTDN